jgi:hypothetical protein
VTPACLASAARVRLQGMDVDGVCELFIRAQALG